MKQTLYKCLIAGGTALSVILLARYWSALSSFAGMLLAAAWPLLLGAIIAYIANILMGFYERHLSPPKPHKLWDRLRRPICMLLAFVTVLAALILLVQLILPQLISCFSVLLDALPDALRSLYAWLERHFHISELLQEQSLTPPTTTEEWHALVEKLTDWLFGGVGGFMNAAVALTSSLIGILITIFMSLIFAVNILMHKERLIAQCQRLFRRCFGQRALDRAQSVMAVVNDSFHSYIVGQCVEAIILGCLCTLGMLALQLPYAMMIGPLVGVTALIPIAGAYIGAAVGAVMIFSQSAMQAVIFLIFLVILQQIEGNLIYPHTVGSSLKLPGIWVLAAVLIGGGVMGIAGMMLFVPLTAAVYRLLSRWVAAGEAQQKLD